MEVSRWPSGSHRGATRHAPHQQLRQTVDDQSHEEENEPDLDQGAQVEVAGGLAEFVGDDAGQRVTGSEERLSNLGAIADDHGDGHSLARSATQTEYHGADYADARVAENAEADHFPAGGAKRLHSFTLMVWHYRHHLATDGTNNGNDHDGDDDAGCQHADAKGRAAEQSSPAKTGGKKRLNVLAKQRREHEDPP